ncbi:MAG: AmmeMemoRadiSam system radical SAM enzyme [Candidatus Heimdallarchaeota archaeon]|nr:AmmeMemoRadiSam system radical SAM enzyme [Candidatus Heimdallarchaeota archaeon]MCK4954783.1 AmmeMemoRadiSam system radical SAM enzyme [Candidatus Heimdallarchaeota archaeon]
MTTPLLHEAEYYEIINDELHIVQCHLCPHECELMIGDKGKCLSRMNISGKLYSLTYGYAEMKIDLIEKQYVYHFYPNARVQTFSTYNCNIDCDYCPSPEKANIESEKISGKRFAPDQAVMFGMASGTKAICFGEAEPLVSFEWVRDTAKLAKERGMKVLVRTNGFFNEAPILELLDYIDAITVNIKATSEESYLALCKGGSFEHVKRIVKIIHEKEKLLELTILIHEDLNNTEENALELASWMASELGPEVPLHLARLKPSHRTKHLQPTSKELLERAYVSAKDKGLQFVYIDDVLDHEANHTYCPKCGELLIQRNSTMTEVRRISLQGHCNKCQTKLNIVIS